MIRPRSSGMTITDDSSPFGGVSSYKTSFTSVTGKFRRTQSFRVRDVYKVPQEKLACDTMYSSHFTGKIYSLGTMITVTIFIVHYCH